MWEDTGQILKEFSDSNFPPEQIQNPAEFGKYLRENCSNNSSEKKLIVMCWALVNAYHTVLDTVGQQIQPEGQEDESADTPVTQAAAKPDRKPKPIAIAPVQKREHKAKSTDDGELGLS